MRTKAMRGTALLMASLLWALTATCTLWLATGKVGAPGGGSPGGTGVVGESSSVRQPVPELRSVRIRTVGDLMVHQAQLDFARQPDGSYDFHDQYALVADALADADYTIANLETTVGKQEGRDYSGYPMFNSPESLLDTLRDAGVDFLTLANNHILDRSLDGMYMTVDNVERYGFDHGGANRSPEEKQQPVLAEVGGIRIGFLCYTEMTNGMEKSGKGAARKYGVNYLRDADLEADVAALKAAGAEVVIALPHWGLEYRREPEASTVKMAEKMIAAGVDVVLGSHPHMVQPVRFLEVETETGETRTGLVAYSMGNFISNQSDPYTDSGILVDFTLAERETGGFEVTDVQVMPTFCWRQEDNIQTLPALEYYDAPPRGMDAETWIRLRESVDDVRELIEGRIPLIAG